AAKRVPDEHRPLELEHVDHRTEIGSPPIQRELALLELTGARAAAEADAHQLIPVAEPVAEPVPEGRLQAEPVDEDQRQAHALRLDVKLGAVDENLWLNELTPPSRCSGAGHARRLRSRRFALTIRGVSWRLRRAYAANHVHLR